MYLLNWGNHIACIKYKGWGFFLFLEYNSKFPMKNFE